MILRPSLKRIVSEQPRGVALLFLLFAIIPPTLAQESEAVAENSFWLWAFLGRLHPMIVHFPISLLFMALLMEIISWKRKTNDFRAAIHVMILIGAVSAVVSVVFGLLLSKTEAYGSDILPIHQWSGIATMLLASFTAIASLKNEDV